MRLLVIIYINYLLTIYIHNTVVILYEIDFVVIYLFYTFHTMFVKMYNAVGGKKRSNATLDITFFFYKED